MQPIVTPAGVLVAWFRDPHVVNEHGEDVAFVQAWGVFGYDGALRGYFEEGLFRNKAGLIVARIGVRPSLPAPEVEWSRARIKKAREPALIIHFPDESDPDGWREMFSGAEVN